MNEDSKNKISKEVLEKNLIYPDIELSCNSSEPHL